MPALLPHFSHAAPNRELQSWLVWSTKNASIISIANTTDKFCCPWP